jgi:hypothetical protein
MLCWESQPSSHGVNKGALRSAGISASNAVPVPLNVDFTCAAYLRHQRNASLGAEGRPSFGMKWSAHKALHQS